MSRKLMFIPLILILAVCAMLLLGLQQDPKKIASALIGKPVPEFSQADLFNPTKQLSNQNLPNEVFLINVWGSWCEYCKQEHQILMELAQQGVKIVGLNYRDKPQSAVAMLERMGNPFVLVVNDSKGTLAMKLGVDGAPETYIVDKHGVIRYRHSGAFDPDLVQKVILPELAKWK